MEQNTVKLTAKEVVKDQIASTLRHIDRRIAVISEKMNADYLHFFEWQAEEMFKVQKRRAFFTEFTKVVKNLDEDVDLTAWLFAIANRKSGELVRGSLTRNSTNPMANLAHLLNLEAEQEIIRGLESLAHVAEYNGKC